MATLFLRVLDKTELIRKIQEIEGLSAEERSALLQLLRCHKKYGLVWEDKPEKIEENLREELPVLTERDDEKVHPIISDNPDAPNHIIIEGDNLAALTELSYTHAGKIDVIYIDPPYNTGHRDFAYNDKYIDPDDPYKHSMWLSFMSKRLRIAKELLSDRGVIYISIDDNEAAALKMLCDEIFVERNFICQFIWQQGKKSSGNLVGVNQEYIICYAKNRALIDNPEMSWKTKKKGLDKIYAKYQELRKKYGKDNIKIQTEIRVFFSSLQENDPAFGSKHYNYVDDNGLFFADNSCAPDRPETRCHKPLIHPVTMRPTAVPRLGWRWKESTLDKLVSEGRIYFGETETTIPKIKKYLKDMEFEMPSTVFYKDGRGASAELDAILGEKLFNNPKDRFIIASLLSFRDNSIILDFFAGSGTTLHAVMQLNAEDGGHRTCILCQGIEQLKDGTSNNICENVTYERNKRVILGYTKPNGEAVEGLSDNNLRYYRTEFLPRERTVRNMRRLVRVATGLLCIKNDLYTEAPFGGGKLNPRYARFFEHGSRRMLVIYEERAVRRIAELIKAMPGEDKIKIYVFSHGSYAYDDEFALVADRVELCALPQAIYDAYQRVLPRRKPQFLHDKIVEKTEKGESE